MYHMIYQQSADDEEDDTSNDLKDDDRLKWKTSFKTFKTIAYTYFAIRSYKFYLKLLTMKNPSTPCTNLVLTRSSNSPLKMTVMYNMWQLCHGINLTPLSNTQRNSCTAIELKHNLTFNEDSLLRQEYQDLVTNRFIMDMVLMKKWMMK